MAWKRGERTQCEGEMIPPRSAPGSRCGNIVVTFLLGFVLWVSLAVPEVLAQNVAPALRFSNQGTFKILQIADMHYGDGAVTPCRDLLSSQLHHCSDINTTAFISRLLAAEKPDFVVFTGDNIDFDATNATKSMDESFAPVIAAKIPWAAILGNHDQESSLPRDKVMSYLTQMDYSLSQVLNPTMESLLGKPKDTKAPIEINGFGNYYLQVFGPLGSDNENSSLLNLYFLDSGDYSKFDTVGGYDWIRASQLLWFETLSAKLRTAKASANTPSGKHTSPTVTPALAYFHIPLPEYNIVLANPSMLTGEKQEAICSATVNSGFFTSLVEAGDVKATFVGHDHVNDYCGSLLGINLCYGGGTGYHGYGKAGWPRRARVVLASLGRDNNGGSKVTQEIATWKRLDDVDMSKLDLQVLYNGYAGWWFSRPFFKGNVSFRRGGAGNWIPSLILMLVLSLMAGASFLFNFLFRKLRRPKGTGFVAIEGGSSVESNDVYE